VRTATIPVFGTLITNTAMKEVSRLYLFQPMEAVMFLYFITDDCYINCV